MSYVVVAPRVDGAGLRQSQDVMGAILHVRDLPLNVFDDSRLGSVADLISQAEAARLVLAPGLELAVLEKRDDEALPNDRLLHFSVDLVLGFITVAVALCYISS